MSFNQARILGVFIFGVFLAISLTHAGAFTFDETQYHFPNLVNFHENGLAALFNLEYRAANAPLPYLLVVSVQKIFGRDVIVARLVTCVVSIMTFFIALKLFELYKIPAGFAFVPLFYPYFFVNSFIFYAVNYGLLFALLSLLFLHNNEKQGAYLNNFVSGAFVSLAILSQQFYLIIPGAVMLFRLYSLLTENGNRLTIPARMMISSALYLAPLLVPFALFLAWKGLTPPFAQEVNTLGFYPSTILSIFVATGFYFFPFAIPYFKFDNIVKSGNIAVLALALSVSIVLAVFFKPIPSDYYCAGAFCGIVNTLLQATGKIHPVLHTAGMAGLCFCGIIVLIRLGKMVGGPHERLLFLISLLLAASFTFNTCIGERHLISYMFLLFFLILPRFTRSMKFAYPVFMSMMGIFYYFYFLFLKAPAMGITD